MFENLKVEKRKVKKQQNFTKNLGSKLIFLTKIILLCKSKTVFTKYNYFFVCSILFKKLTNFDPPKSELNNLTNNKLILSL